MTALQKRSQGYRMKVHDRRAKDIPINAVTAPIVVDDPYERGEKIETTASLRDDILRHMRVRDEIDDAQFHAGRLYERYVEKSQIGSVKAMDPTKEPVDGGGVFYDPLTDTQVDASRQLSEAARVLGRRGETLVRLVLIDRKKFKEVAASQSERDIAYIRRAFFDCLDELAIFWCLAGKK